jgi:hypothetical protein
MGYRDATYVIFDGDTDKWAYAYMKGWNANEKVDFDFRDAHDIDTMTASAQNEQYIKSKLRPRMKSSSAVVVLVGEITKWLYKYVRWELELALELGLPIVAASLAGKKQIDPKLMPPILRDKCIVQVPFKMKAIKYALDNWPMLYRSFSPSQIVEGPRHYTEQVYSSLGL